MSNFIKNLFRRYGFELLRYNPHNSHHCATRAMLKYLKIDLVFDVGANVGQFGGDLFASGFKGRIVSFEPIANAHAKLTRRAKANPNWLVYPRSAVGATMGQISINVSENTVSSSALPMLKLHNEVAPKSKYISTEDVPLVRLDDIVEQYYGSQNGILLKVDTQGFEWEVLDGARSLLGKVSAVQLELALMPLYQGQHPWRDYVDRLESEGFHLHFAYPAFTNPVNGQTLQWDAMFVRQ